ncbi:MAG: ribosome-binding factor [Patescibacteria group bacterium]|jgi:ribosome-binding factor A|nr:ribosome-binding factor [Patescibacteria group bacterium]
MRHHEQKEALFIRLAAEFINTESNRQSLITVTRGQLSDDERRVDLFFTVLPESKEEEVGVFLMRNRAPFRDYVKKHSENLRVLPTFDFKLDVGEKNRLDLEALSQEEASENKA